MTDLGPGSAGQGGQGTGKQVTEGLHDRVQAGEGGIKPRERQVKDTEWVRVQISKGKTKVRSNNRSPGGKWISDDAYV